MTLHCCEGCDRPLNSVAWLLGPVCWDCVKSRQRAVVEGRCRCGRRRREVEVNNEYRRWVSCRRCLGFVREVR